MMKDKTMVLQLGIKSNVLIVDRGLFGAEPAMMRDVVMGAIKESEPPENTVQKV